MSENRDLLLAAASELRSLDADNEMLIQTTQALAEQRNQARARVKELEAKCAELEAKCAELLNASKLVVERWDSPLWRWEGHTGVLVTRLRSAIAKAEGAQP